MQVISTTDADAQSASGNASAGAVSGTGATVVDGGNAIV
jgi:hypothetical protein